MVALLAFVLGTLLGTAVTASLFRTSQARNVRNAVASVQRYLVTDDANKPLGPMTSKLKLHLDLINEADDLVSRSEWAKRQKHRFVSLAVQMIRARNKTGKALTAAQKMQLGQAQERLKQSGDWLLGYWQFPSWLWVRASIARVLAALKARQGKPAAKQARA